MQQKQKHILRLIAVLAIFLSVYALWSRTTVDEKNPAVIQNINTKNVDTPNSGDTIDRLKAYSGAETKWGISPFSSGQPLEIDKEKQITGSTIPVKPITIPKPSIQKSIPDHPVFHPSITEWKTRTLSGVTYVFGQGNPAEVALMPDQILDILHCGPSAQDSAGYCPEGLGYVTPMFEKKLKAVLEHPYWERLITECVHEYKPLLYDGRFEKYVVSGYGRDINNLLTIDLKTGRKEIKRNESNTWNILYLRDALSSLGFDQDTGNWTPCLGKYSPILIQLLQETEGVYVSA
jgi:hypothetical protein